jgi:hypothetical protein
MKNLNCSRDFLSMCGDRMMLSGADVLLIVPAFAPFNLNGNTRVGTVYMVVLKNIVWPGFFCGFKK